MKNNMRLYDTAQKDRTHLRVLHHILVRNMCSYSQTGEQANPPKVITLKGQGHWSKCTHVKFHRDLIASFFSGMVEQSLNERLPEERRKQERI